MRFANNMSTKKTAIAAIFVCLCSGFWGNSAMIFLKANLAKILIAKAWQQSLSDGAIHKPWPWADTWPVGKVYLPKRGKSLYILSGAHGSALAFGPGLMDGTALPSESGTKVIGGHRDTHFKFLQEVKAGEMFLLQSKSGQWRYYRFRKFNIADSSLGPWQIDVDKDEVHFITCYPFDSMVPGGPLRFVAIATPMFTQSDKPVAQDIASK